MKNKYWVNMSKNIVNASFCNHKIDELVLVFDLGHKNVDNGGHYD